MLLLCIRFYPGVASSNNLRLSEPERLAGSIEAPEFDRTTFGSSSARAGGPDTSGRVVRATRVVGSLDHAVLPVPPVCDSFEDRPAIWALVKYVLFSERQ
jgi:hypothetical protein